MKTIYLIFTFSILSTFAFGQHEFHPSQLIAEIQSDTQFEIDNGNIEIRNEKFFALNSKWNLRSIKPLVNPGNENKKSRKRTERLVLLSFNNPIDILQAISEYNASGIFRLLEPNFKGYGAGMAGLVPNDWGYAGRQWGLSNDGTFNNISEAGADISMENAWETSTGNNSTIISILDSGLKLDHPEFENRLWNNSGETDNNNSDDDNNGYADDINGWDFVNNDNTPVDDHGHGTNVTGIMAATGNNSIGYAGVDWKAKIMTGKILNANNSGFYSNWISAIYYSVDNGAEVINMSVGGPGFSAFMKDACDFAAENDVAIFVSMMNVNNNDPYYPAAYSSTIAVGATDTNDERVNPFFWSTTSGSNYGNHIDICAPGNFMYGLSNSSNTNYGSYWGGTSQAAPLAAGVASIMKGLDPSLTVEEIRTILRNTADDQVGKTSEDTPGWDQFHGSGRLNASAALELLNIQVSTDNPNAQQNFNINPNPINKNGLISIQSNDFLSNANIEIFNAAGELISIHQHNFSLGKFEINAPSIFGLYFIRISTENNNTITKKILVTSE